MKTIHNVTGADILASYIKLTGEKFNSPKDIEHFTQRFNEFADGVRNSIAERRPSELSLNKKNFWGKRTRALLDAIQMKEPKTLGLLIEKLWNEIPEK